MIAGAPAPAAETKAEATFLAMRIARAILGKPDADVDAAVGFWAEAMPAEPTGLSASFLAASFRPRPTRSPIGSMPKAAGWPQVGLEA